MGDGPLVTNYEAMITRFTWWIDKKQRTWVVTGVLYDGPTPQTLKPYKVELLEFQRHDPVERPWEEICDYIKRNVFIKLAEPPKIER